MAIKKKLVVISLVVILFSIFLIDFANAAAAGSPGGSTGSRSSGGGILGAIGGFFNAVGRAISGVGSTVVNAISSIGRAIASVFTGTAATAFKTTSSSAISKSISSTRIGGDARNIISVSDARANYEQGTQVNPTTGQIETITGVSGSKQDISKSANECLFYNVDVTSMTVECPQCPKTADGKAIFYPGFTYYLFFTVQNVGKWPSPATDVLITVDDGFETKTWGINGNKGNLSSFALSALVNNYKIGPILDKINLFDPKTGKIRDIISTADKVAQNKSINYKAAVKIYNDKGLGQDVIETTTYYNEDGSINHIEKKSLCAAGLSALLNNPTDNGVIEITVLGDRIPDDNVAEKSIDIQYLTPNIGQALGLVIPD